MRASKIMYREFWGQAKRLDILESLEKGDTDFEASYVELFPSIANRFSLRSTGADGDYLSWPLIPTLAAIAPFNGPVEGRGLALISLEKSLLYSRMQAYFDSEVPDDAIKAIYSTLMMTGNRIEGPKARRKILVDHRFNGDLIVRFPWKPFDERWCYLANIRPLFSEPSPDLILLRDLPGQRFFMTRDDSDTPHEGRISYFSQLIADRDLLRGHARLFPLFLPHSSARAGKSGSAQYDLNYQHSKEVRPNLSAAALAWLATLSLPATPETSRLVWHHALAITYSPAYLAENAAGIRQGWPRIPLPGDADLLRASAALGERLAALLDPEANVPGLGQGLLASIAIPSTVPAATRDWQLNGWGSRTDKGVTMPGRGKTDLRPYAETEAAAQEQAALLGAQTRDVWMNGASFWKNIPDAVWETHIGGYQVLKKWLSYRDHSIIARPLSQEEVAHIQATARRLAAILLMGPDLDANYRASAEAHVPLPVT
jgi:hypothetical protein